MEDKEKNTQIPVIRLDRQLKYEGNILKIYEDKVLANGHEAKVGFHPSRWCGGCPACCR